MITTQIRYIYKTYFIVCQLISTNKKLGLLSLISSIWSFDDFPTDKVHQNWGKTPIVFYLTKQLNTTIYCLDINTCISCSDLCFQPLPSRLAAFGNDCMLKYKIFPLQVVISKKNKNKYESHHYVGYLELRGGRYEYWKANHAVVALSPHMRTGVCYVLRQEVGKMTRFSEP